MSSGKRMQNTILGLLLSAWARKPPLNREDQLDLDKRGQGFKGPRGHYRSAAMLLAIRIRSRGEAVVRTVTLHVPDSHET